MNDVSRKKNGTLGRRCRRGQQEPTRELSQSESPPPAMSHPVTGKQRSHDRYDGVHDASVGGRSSSTPLAAEATSHDTNPPVDRLPPDLIPDSPPSPSCHRTGRPSQGPPRGIRGPLPQIWRINASPAAARTRTGHKVAMFYIMAAVDQIPS